MSDKIVSRTVRVSTWWDTHNTRIVHEIEATIRVPWGKKKLNYTELLDPENASVAWCKEWDHTFHTCKEIPFESLPPETRLALLGAAITKARMPAAMPMPF